MKIKIRKAPTPQVQAFLDQLHAASESEKLELLLHFQWKHDKPDLHYWVPLLNYFDDVLSNVAARKDVNLQCEEEDATPFPSKLVGAIMRVTATLLEHCNYKQLYDSLEHIPALLSAPNDHVVDETLAMLLAYSRRPTPHLKPGVPTLNLLSRLYTMHEQWGTQTGDATMLEYVKGTVPEKYQDVFGKGDGFSFNTHLGLSSMESLEPSEDADKPECVPASIANLASHSPAISDYDILKKIVAEHSIRQDSRFEMLHMIRSARRMKTPEGRRMVVTRRLLAFMIFLQATPPVTLSNVLTSNLQSFTADLFSIMRATEDVPEMIRAVVMRVIATMASNRQRQTVVVNAVQVNPIGMWASLIKDSVDRLLAGQNDASLIQIMESLLAFFLGLITHASGPQIIQNLDMNASLLPLLKDHDRNHVRVVGQACRAMESYMETSEEGVTSFNELNGFKALMERLDHEVSRVNTADGSEMQEVGLQVNMSTRNLIKFLVRMACNRDIQPHGTSREENENLQVYYNSMKKIILNSKEFGTYLYNTAIQMVTEAMHNSPMEFPRLADSGVVKAVVQSLMNGVTMSSESIIQIPAVIAAFCLHATGKELMESEKAIECLLDVMLNQSYLKYLTTDCIYGLGAALDELVRHQPSFKDAVADVLIKALKTILVQALMNSPTPTTGLTSPNVRDMDITQIAYHTSIMTISQDPRPHSVSDDRVSPEDGSVIAEKLPRVIRVIEASMGNANIIDGLIDRGLVPLLLEVYRMKGLAAPPGSHNTYTAVIGALRGLAGCKYDAIAKPLVKLTKERLTITRDETLDFRGPIVMTEPLVCSKCTEALQHAGDLLGLVASIARNSPGFIAELEEPGITPLVGELECLVAKQLATSQRWRSLFSVRRDIAKVESEAKAQGKAMSDQLLESIALLKTYAGAEESTLPESSNAEEPPAGSGLLTETVEDDKSKEPFKSKQEEVYQQLNCFIAHIHIYYCQIAKHVHNQQTVRRRAVDKPSPELARACAQACISIRDSLLYVEKSHPGLIASFSESRTPSDMEGARDLIGYIHQIATSLAGLLFDDRRQTCHSLMLSYFAQCGGLQIFLDYSRHIFDLALKTGPAMSTAKPTPLGIIGVRADLIPLTMCKEELHICCQKLMQMCETLVHSQIICNSPSAQMFLTLPVPGTSKPAPFTSAQQFAAEVQVRTLRALSPLLKTHSALQKIPVFAQRLLSIMNKAALEPPKAAPSTAPAPAQAVNPVNDAAIQSITEMGFTAGQAREALTRVRYGVEHYSVEMAIEWLMTHPLPADPAPETKAPKAAEAALEQDNPPANFYLPHRSFEPAESETAVAPTSSGEASSSKPSQPATASSKAMTVMSRSEMVNTALEMLFSSKLVFDAADLISVLCSQEPADSKSEVISIVAKAFRKASNYVKYPFTPRSEDVDQLKDLSHLLCILSASVLSDKIPDRGMRLTTQVYSSGVVTDALDLLEAVAEGKWPPEAINNAVPAYADCLLVMLDCLASAQAKTPKGLGALKSPAFQLAHHADLFSGSGDDIALSQLRRGLVHAMRAVETRSEPADAANSASATPQGTTDKPTGDGPSSSKAAGAAEDVKSKTAKDPVESLRETIRDMYSVGGLLSEEEQQRSLAICVKFLIRFKDQPQPQATASKEAGSHVETCRAVLQLIARLTKNFPRAQQALTAKVPSLILSLPASCFKAEISAHICAIFRRLVEDPATLQSAMEAEITAALAKRPAQIGGGMDHTMQLSLFLQHLEAVIGRDPCIFFEALKATCQVKLQGRTSYIGLIPKERPASGKSVGKEHAESGLAKADEEMPEANKAATPRKNETPQPALKPRRSMDARGKSKEDKGLQSKSSLKNLKKVVHPNFMEIVDVLVDHILHYKSSELPESTAKGDAIGSETAEASKTPGLENQSEPQSSTAAETATLEKSAKQSTKTQPAVQVMDERGRQVLVQFLCLKMLSELTLKYTPAVALLLRRDSEYGARTPYGKTPRKEIKQTGLLIRHILKEHVALDKLSPDWNSKELSRMASSLLLAIVIRSSEGKKRVLQCTAEKLAARDGKKDSKAGAKKKSSYAVEALAELIFLVLSAHPTGNAFNETMQCLGKNGVRESLLAHLRESNVLDPEVVEVLQKLLRPLELLTRPGVQAALKGEVKASSRPENADKTPSTVAGDQTAPNKSRQGPEPGGRSSQAESAAGPEAMAIAEHVMRANNDARPSVIPSASFADFGQFLSHSLSGVSVEQIEQTVEHLADLLAQGRTYDQLRDEMDGGPVQISIEQMEDDENMEENDFDDDDDDDDDDDGESDDEDEDDDDDEDMSDGYDEDVPQAHGYDHHQAFPVPTGNPHGDDVVMEMEIAMEEAENREHDEDDDDDEDEDMDEDEDEGPVYVDEGPAFEREMQEYDAAHPQDFNINGRSSDLLFPHLELTGGPADEREAHEIVRRVGQVMQGYDDEEEEEEEEDDDEEVLDDDEGDEEDVEGQQQLGILEQGLLLAQEQQDALPNYHRAIAPIPAHRAFATRMEGRRVMPDEVLTHMMTAFGVRPSAGRGTDPRRRTGFANIQQTPAQDTGVTARHSVLQRPRNEPEPNDAAAQARASGAQQQPLPGPTLEEATAMFGARWTQPRSTADLQRSRLPSSGRAPPSTAPPTGVLAECIATLTTPNISRSRTCPDAWSDTGLPTTFHSTFRPAVLAGLLEREISEVLRAPEPPPAPAAAPAPEAAAAAPATAAPATAANLPPTEAPAPAAGGPVTAEALQASLQASQVGIQEADQPRDNASPPDTTMPDTSMQDAENTGDVEMTEPIRTVSDVSMRSAPEGLTTHEVASEPAVASAQQPANAAAGTPHDTAAQADPQSQEIAEAREQENAELEAVFAEALPQDEREVYLNVAEIARNIEPTPAAEPQPDQSPAQTGEASGSRPRTEIEQLGIDPDFWAALPLEMRDEVLEGARREYRQARARRQREEAAQRATAAGGSAAPADQGITDTSEIAALLASFPVEARQDFLLGTDDDTLRQLGVMEEAERVRSQRDSSMNDRFSRIHAIMDERIPVAERAGNFQPVPAVGRRGVAPSRPSAAQQSAETSFDKSQLDSLEPPVSKEDIAQLISILCHPHLQGRDKHRYMMKMLVNLCFYKVCRRTILRMILLTLAPEARHSPLLQNVKTLEKGDKKSHMQRCLSETYGYIIRTIQQILPEYIDELAYLSIPWPAPEDKKGKSVGRNERPEAAIQILLKILGSKEVRSLSFSLMSILALLEGVLGALKEGATQKADSSSRPGKRPRPGSLETLEEGMENVAMDQDSPDTDAQPQSESAAQPPKTGEAETSERNLGASVRTEPSASRATSARDPDLDMDAFKFMPHSYLEDFIDLLGGPQASHSGALRIGKIAFLIIEREPSLAPVMIKALRRRLDKCGQETAAELDKLSKGDLNSLAAQGGTSVLHILKGLEAMRKRPAGEEAWQNEERVKLQFSKLEPLWEKLSSMIGIIEHRMKQATTAAQAFNLPVEATQIQSIVEAFFVVCDAQMASKPIPDATLLRATSSDLRSAGSASLRLSMVGAVAAPSQEAGSSSQEPEVAGSSKPAGPLSPALSKELPAEQREALEAHLPLIRFTERHKLLINAYLKQRPELLQGNMAALLKQPRLIDFEAKKQYFRSVMSATRDRLGHGSRNVVKMTLRRDYVFEDSFRQMNVKTPAEIKGKINVHFRGEEGIDMGGVTREWYQIIAKEMFNANFSLFIPVPEASLTFQPNPNSDIQNDEARGTSHLDFFKFVGRVVGRALFEGQTIDAHFTRSLYKHMLCQPLTYEDLEAVDPDFYKSLGWVLENNVEEFGIDDTFTAEVDFFGRKDIIELKPGGKDIKLCEANKKEYVDLKAQHTMTISIHQQLKAFCGGFWDIIPKDIVRIFNDKELELMISGLPEIDVHDMRANSQLAGYDPGNRVLHWFWDIVFEMDRQDLALLVQFITGTSKVPLDGFGALQGMSGPQKLIIQRVHADPPTRLPQAHTCFHTLDLPEYESKAVLHQQLLLAIREGSEGFGFS